MINLHFFSDFFFSVCTPALLLSCGAYFAFRLHIGRLLLPKRFLHTLLDIPPDSKTTPFKALSMALAGTLGVGNITGVASAICQGGPGALFWMWVGALLSLSVKYSEVALAVRYRRHSADGAWYGGAMFTIRDGLGNRWLGGLFAILCILNSLITGNIVQANAAADCLHPLPESMSGFLLVLLSAAAFIYGVRRVGNITVRLIPLLTLVYIGTSVWILFSNFSLLPSVFADIFKRACSFRAVFGGACGWTVREAIRYGITRGIFSNEAGCGTSPTAHASADTKSPYHQGVFGIFEVLCDTPFLCTLTGLVLCIADRRCGILSGAAEGMSLRAFGFFGGRFLYIVLAVSVFLFAYATILAQVYYGMVALSYFSQKRLPRLLYAFFSLICTYAGAILSPGAMWSLADTVVCLMTCLNTLVLFRMRREISDTLPVFPSKEEKK